MFFSCRYSFLHQIQSLHLRVGRISPHMMLMATLTVKWTASPSGDIANYRLEVYSDASCSTIDGTATTVVTLLLHQTTLYQ